jgi:hypothetical protein
MEVSLSLSLSLSLSFCLSPGLNSELHTFWTGILPHEPHLSLFLLWFFILELGSCFLPGQPGAWWSYFMIPAIAGMSGIYNYPWLFSVKMRSHKLFCLEWTGSTLLLHRWNDRYVPPCPDIGWYKVLLTFCLGWPQTMIFLISTCQIARITGVSHLCMAWEFSLFSKPNWKRKKNSSLFPGIIRASWGGYYTHLIV